MELGVPQELHTFFVTMYINECRLQPILTTKFVLPIRSLCINEDLEHSKR